MHVFHLIFILSFPFNLRMPRCILQGCFFVCSKVSSLIAKRKDIRMRGRKKDWKTEIKKERKKNKDDGVKNKSQEEGKKESKTRRSSWVINITIAQSHSGFSKNSPHLYDSSKSELPKEIMMIIMMMINRHETTTEKENVKNTKAVRTKNVVWHLPVQAVRRNGFARKKYSVGW